MLKKPFSDDSMSNPRVSELYKRFKGQREIVMDDECKGVSARSSLMEKLKKVYVVITIGNVTDELGNTSRSCKVIFANVLNMNRVAAKVIPKMQNCSLTPPMAMVT